jgi:hypothetical protein
VMTEAVSAHEALLRAGFLVIPVDSNKQPVGAAEGDLRHCYQAPDSRGRITKVRVKCSMPYKLLYIYRDYAVEHADSLPRTLETLTVGALYKDTGNIVSWPNCVRCVLCALGVLCVLHVRCVLCVPSDNASAEAI